MYGLSDIRIRIRIQFVRQSVMQIWKNRLQDGFHYIPKRAGSINEETKYVLQHFGVEPPEYAEDAVHR